MSTIESNRLIAEFMGGKYIPDNEYVFSHFIIGGVVREPSYVKYNSSWDWLMPVIEKCLIYCHENMLNEWENGFSDSFLSANFNVLFKITTQFIQFHNEQQKVVQNDSKRN